MRRTVKFLLTLLLCSTPASAATYYISFSSGSNSNNGTSNGTPWKSHPYMQTVAGCGGAAPTYVHSAGDKFIFKQGDTWPNACFDMAVAAGGGAGNPDIYTFDPTWGVAGGTSGNLGQNVGVYKFDAGGLVINGTDGWNDFVFCNTKSNITFNGMELTGMIWTGTGGSYGNVFMWQLQDSQNVIISNIWAHGWTHSGATVDQLTVVVGRNATPFNAGTRITGGVFDGANSGGAGIADSGSVSFAIPIQDNNIIRNMTNGPLLGQNGVAHDNLIGPINQSFQAANHENCIEPISLAPGLTSTVLIYNNVWHDCTAVGLLTQGAAPSNGIEKDYIWNNVAYVGSVGSPPIPMDFASISTSNGSSEVHAWNNTIFGGSGGQCFRAASAGNGNFGVLDLENNHCISGVGLILLDAGMSVTTNTDNILQSLAVAAGQGYTSAEMYAYSPTAGGNATVGTGANLTSFASGNEATLVNDTTYGGSRVTHGRPGVGAWDVGAYEFVGIVPNPPASTHVIVIN